MSGGQWLMLVAIVVLFLASIALALSETAFTRMSRIRALALEEEGVKNAGRLAALLESPVRTLNAVLLVVLACQLASATLIGVLVEGLLGAIGVAVGTVVEVVLFFVIGEVAPKTYAIQHTERAALRVTPLLHFLTTFPPLRLVSRGLIGLANVVLPGRGLREGPFVTEEEIRTMADVAAEEQSIESQERRLIHSIFEFGDTLVREVMTPRPDMIGVEADCTVVAAMQQAIEHGFSRLPAYEDSTDNIVGLVYLRDLVTLERAGKGGQRVRDAARPAVFVPEQKRVAELLREMQQEHFHMAIVVDEYGGTAGLVTMEDLLEEIVGEIADEYDRAEPHLEHLADGSLRVPGRTPIDDVNEELDVELPDDEWDTVGGLVFNLLGHVPDEGETVRFDGLEFRAERLQGHRIVTVRVRRLEPSETAEHGPDRETPNAAEPPASSPTPGT
ncbi:MAG TPA: hemolysin family protein [Acidimicrobiia bacterium]|nr:hemolysin family protein [Acidimicrobiia bacterium]